MARQPAKTISQIETAEAKEDKRKETKEFVVRHVPERGLYEVAYTAGGEVPDQLKGMWTNQSRAQAAIANYITTRARQEAAA